MTDRTRLTEAGQDDVPLPSPPVSAPVRAPAEADENRSGEGKSGRPLSGGGGILEPVAIRVSSPHVVGRDAELTALREHARVAATGRPRVVVISGEAGVGKTRLIGEFERVMVADGARVIVGGCLELSAEGLPFAPLTAALRRLAREIGTPALCALVPDATPLGRLLPELVAPGAEDVQLAQTRLFETFLLLLERLADERPLVLVVEDLHWADRSTRDMLSFITRNLRTGRFLLMTTYRSDDLHRRHPLRQFLAELERLPLVDHIDLDRLPRAGVAAMVEGIVGVAPSATSLDALMRRTEGNPLFVEALVCDAEQQGEIEGSLRDLLLRSMQRLPDRAQQIVRIAAAAGHRVGYGLLAACWPGDAVELDAALREAVELNVLVAGRETFSFRHALIREAVDEELLPGERVSLHRRLAEAIEHDPALVPSGRAGIEIAHHWDHAYVLDRALAAAWRAASDAASSFAYAEQLALVERVLALWHQVPDAEARTGAGMAGVLQVASEAALNSGDPYRADAYASRALDVIDVAAEPARAALLLLRRAWMRLQLRENELPDLIEAARLADVASDPEVVALARGRLAAAQSLANSYPEARDNATRALQVARSLDSPRALAIALNAMSLVHGQEGEYDCAIEHLVQAQQAGRAAGSLEETLRATVNLIDAHTCLGRYDEAIAIGVGAIEQAKRVGLERTTGAFLSLNVVEPLVALGQWNDALALIDDVLLVNPPPRHQSMLLRNKASILLRRGDMPAARAAVAAALRSRPEEDPQPQHQLPLDLVTAEIAAVHGDRERALDVVLVALDTTFRPGMARYAWPLAAFGIGLAVGQVERGRMLRDDAVVAKATAALDTLVGRADALPVDIPVLAAWRLVGHAARTGALDDWLAAAVAWQAVGDPYERAYALMRAGEAAAAAGDGTGAAELLTCAREAARRTTATALVTEIDDLGHRARLHLGSPDVPSTSGGTPATGGTPPAPVTALAAGSLRDGGVSDTAVIGLTDRETDVLRLLTEGLSNREIGARLFISPKTASVHVSNLMAKLGAPSRTAAAAAAHRLGLFDRDTGG